MSCIQRLERLACFLFLPYQVIPRSMHTNVQGFEHAVIDMGWIRYQACFHSQNFEIR